MLDQHECRSCSHEFEHLKRRLKKLAYRLRAAMPAVVKGAQEKSGGRHGTQPFLSLVARRAHQSTSQTTLPTLTLPRVQEPIGTPSGARCSGGPAQVPPHEMSTRRLDKLLRNRVICSRHERPREERRASVHRCTLSERRNDAPSGSNMCCRKLSACSSQRSHLRPGNPYYHGLLLSTSTKRNPKPSVSTS